MRKFLFGSLAVLLLVLLLGAVFLARMDLDHYRPQLQLALSDTLNRPVSIEVLAFDWSTLGVAARGIRIAEDPRFSKDDFLHADALTFSVAFLPLMMERQVQVDALHIEAPSVRLQQDASGRWNIESLWQPVNAKSSDSPADAAPVGLSIDRITLHGGSVELQRAGDQLRRYQAVNLQADEPQLEQAFPFSLSAELPGSGRLDLSGQLGPLDRQSPMRSALQAELTISQLDLAASGWAGDGSQVQGRVQLKFDLTAEGGLLRSEGELSAESLRLLGADQAATAPIRLQLRCDYDLIKRRGTVEQGVLSAGSAEIQLSGDLAQKSQAMRMNLHLKGQALSVDQLQALIPAFGIELPEQSRLSGGELDIQLSVTGPLDGLQIKGPIVLRDTRLDGFSLAGRLSALSALAGLPAPKDTRIDQGSLQFHRGPDGMRFEQIDVHVVDLGQVSGGGRVDASESVDMKLRVKIDPDVAERSGGGAASGTSVGRFTGGAMRYASSRGLDVQVQGSLAAPQIKLSSQALAGSVLSGLLAPDQEDQGSGDEGNTDEVSDRRRIGSALLQLLDKKKDDREREKE
ncbi:AsmA family protein [Pseudomarimonas arenosa]|uniref:AsmA family protein n=1 Tax=Pseudomarimonas arenosa TaxID=2774145 RepID=A0AAW3ZP74_9GAMM|nr:AsmA family protein [Pseudomarimonas arenosa]MBD8526720.1 AsmA family protein [Pseudomarimonas arenosa]